MKFSFFLFLLFSTTSMAQQIIQLYETSIPNSKVDVSIKEKSEVDANGILCISEVTLPALA